MTNSQSNLSSHTIDKAIFIVSRGLEEADWWSVYRLRTGRHLFDTYVPLVCFSISKQLRITPYIGLDVLSDEISDTQLPSWRS